MAKAKKQESEAPSKFTRVYEDDDCRSTWTYDLSKTTHGPVSVELHYKNLPTDKKKTKAKKV